MGRREGARKKLMSFAILLGALMCIASVAQAATTPSLLPERLFGPGPVHSLDLVAGLDIRTREDGFAAIAIGIVVIGFNYIYWRESGMEAGYRPADSYYGVVGLIVIGVGISAVIYPPIEWSSKARRWGR